MASYVMILAPPCLRGLRPAVSWHQSQSRMYHIYRLQRRRKVNFFQVFFLLVAIEFIGPFNGVLGNGKGPHPLGRGFAACPRGPPSGRIEHVVKKG
jgi:hypothetical protein